MCLCVRESKQCVCGRGEERAGGCVCVRAVGVCEREKERVEEERVCVRKSSVCVCGGRGGQLL